MFIAGSSKNLGTPEVKNNRESRSFSLSSMTPMETHWSGACDVAYKLKNLVGRGSDPFSVTPGVLNPVSPAVILRIGCRIGGGLAGNYPFPRRFDYMAFSIKREYDSEQKSPAILHTML